MSTYSAQGDRWTVDNDRNSEENAGSSFQELTKDLMEPEETTGMERLDFDMSDQEKSEQQAPDYDSPSDESVGVKEGNDDDNTVALSVDDDRTVAFSEAGDDDDRTIALSVAIGVDGDNDNGDDKTNAATDMKDKTIEVPKEDDIDDDELSQRSLAEDNLAETKEKAQSAKSEIDNDDDNDDDDDEMEFDMSREDMEQNDESHSNKDEEESNDITKLAENDSVESDDEMEFDMPSPGMEANENEESNSKSPNQNDGDASEETEGDKSPSGSVNPRTPRRSVRSRKPRVLYSEERNESVLASTGKAKKKKSSPKAKKASPKSPKAPTEDDWIEATDNLYVNTEDKSAVTVKEFIVALEEKFERKITKTLKKAVRNRLKAIVNGNVVPSTASDDAEEANNEEEEDPQAPESEESEEEADDEASDYEDEQEKSKRKSSKKNVRPKRRTKTARAAAKVMEAHRLRQKKRAEELKVRNEEMQLDQSKEDEERQEAIAQKFETNTDELRLKRLEDRLDLLQKLDETRISVVTKPQTTPKRSNTKKDDIDKTDAEAKPDDSNAENKDETSDSDSEEESSSDEEELDIVGMKKTFKPLKLLHNHLPSRGLQLLDEIGSPKTRRRASRLQKSNDGNMILSPNKSMGARFALRNALKQKQVRQGNRWLARELGYKTEEDHLKDCQNVAEQKRGLIVKQEQERLKANERKQLRDRLILQEQQGFPEEENEDPDDEAYVPPEEEDEEMQMAKQIEQEAKEQEILQTNNVEEQASDEEEETNLESSPMDDEMETQPPLPDANNAGTDTEKKMLVPALEEVSKSAEMTLENTLLNGNADTSPSTEEPSTTDDAFKTTVASTVLDESVVTPEKNDARSDDEGELEFDGGDSVNEEEEPQKDPNRPRNAGWQAMLEREAEKLKKRKKRKGGLVEEEAEEEEEEEIAGLEDFGFSISKKKKNDDDDDNDDDKLDEEDLKHVVDDVSDGEGDEDAGHDARKRLEQEEEKARHKEILRRMREGYDGRRGGIAGGGAGARGMHRFDQLVAADNREDAKRLGLLNDDEMDTDDEGGNKPADEEEDETALLDKMLKDRFLHRSSVELEENFSEDEEEDEDDTANENSEAKEDDEVKTQERLAKRFAKRARMQRLEELYGDSQEFSQQRLIDEDASMKEELSKMRCGLLRRSSSLSRASSLSRSSSTSSSRPFGRQSSSDSRSGMFQKTSGSLSIALRANKKRRTSFLGGSNAVNGNLTAGATKALSLGPYSQSGFSNHSRVGKATKSTSGSLFARVTK